MEGPSVLIVGAGLSGLAAAQRLRERGVSCLILEAQDRTGGRVYTVTNEDIQQDLGATWFHGATRANAAWRLAEDAGLVKQMGDAVDNDTPSSSELDLGVWLLSKRAAIVNSSGVCHMATDNEHEQILAVARHYGKLLGEIYNDSAQSIDSSLAVGEYLHSGFCGTELSPIEASAFRVCDLLESSVSGCNSSTSQISALRLSEYKELPGPDVALPDGMSSIVKTLEASIPAEVIRLHAEVVKVCLSGDFDLAVVELADGERLGARCILWTPSVNVTKDFAKNNCFDPPLPPWKVNALQGTGQGVVDKVYALVMPLKGVASNHIMPILWLENGKRISQPWARTIYSLLYDPNAGLVNFWLTGDAAIAVENLSDHDLRCQTEEVLSLLYRQDVVVRKVYRSKWGTNKFTRGSYSFPLVGSSKEAKKHLAAPLPSDQKPLLCFAGEATHSSFYSTMHGAIEAGVREAMRCIKYLNTNLLSEAHAPNGI